IRQKHGIGFLSVATSATGFLVIFLYRRRHIRMNDRSYARLVDSHSESAGSNDDPKPIFQPVFLALSPFLMRDTGMIGGGRDALTQEPFADVARGLAR